jgi:exonuclease SbcD
MPDSTTSAESTIPTKSGETFRVVHSADWHLGKQLGNLDRVEEHDRFLDFLLDAIARNHVDLLIVAGDIFDSANPPQSAQRQYYSFLSKLYHQTSCQVLVVGGNHDSPAQLEAPKAMLETMRVRVVGAAVAPEEAIFPYPDAASAKIAVAAVPFLRDRDLRTGSAGQDATAIRKAITTGIAAYYKDVGEAIAPLAEAGAATIATGHLTVTGSSASDSEREIHIGGLGAIDTKLFPEVFDYVALGHLHRPQSCGGRDEVRYSGSPIPLSFSEATDHKEIRILDFQSGKLAAQHQLPIPPTRRLFQLRVRRENLSAEIASFSPAEAELEAWVELVIEDPLAGEDCLKEAHEAAADRPFEIVRVTASHSAARDSLMLDDRGSTDVDSDDLLDDPARVFVKRLDAEDSLSDVERERLELAFRQVLESHQAEANSK